MNIVAVRNKVVSKMVIVALLAVGGLFVAAALPVNASALTANQQAICDSIGSGQDCSSNTNSTTDVDSVLKTAISIFSGVVGVIAVIMIIVSGFKYITAAGDSAKVTSAKNTLVYALIGLVIVGISQAIVQFVLTKTVQS